MRVLCKVIFIFVIFALKMDPYFMPYWNFVMNNDVLEAIAELKIDRDILPQTDLFLLSDRKFIQIFRLSKGMVSEVVELVAPFMISQSRASALSITTRVSITKSIKIR